MEIGRETRPYTSCPIPLSFSLFASRRRSRTGLLTIWSQPLSLISDGRSTFTPWGNRKSIWCRSTACKPERSCIVCVSTSFPPKSKRGYHRLDCLSCQTPSEVEKEAMPIYSDMAWKNYGIN